MALKDGGPAFPRPSAFGRRAGKRGGNPELVESQGSHGMSLRDWFAGQALMGIMGDPGMRPSSLGEFAHMAMRMYQVADAMLKAREVSHE